MKFLEENTVQKKNATSDMIFLILLNARDYVPWTDLCRLKICTLRS